MLELEIKDVFECKLDPNHINFTHKQNSLETIDNDNFAEYTFEFGVNDIFRSTL